MLINEIFVLDKLRGELLFHLDWNDVNSLITVFLEKRRIGGVLILSVFNNVMNLLDVNPFYQIVLKEILLIAAVSFYQKSDKKGI